MKNGTTSHSFDVALIQADQDGLCRAVSPDLLAWCGLTTTDIVGQFIFQLFNSDTKASALAAWERIIGSKELGRFDGVLVAKHGATLPVSITLTPVRGITAITDHWLLAVAPHRHPPAINDGELRLLRAELAETRRRADEQLGALKEEIAQIQRAKEVLLSSIEEESKQRITTLEGELATLRAREEKVAATEQEIPTLRKTISDLEARVRSTSEDATTQIGRLTAELTLFRERATSSPEAGAPPLEPSAAALRAENITLIARVRSAEDDITALRRDLTHAKDEVARRADDTAHRTELDELRRELSETRAARDALLSTAQKDLQERVAEREKQLTAAAATAAETARQEIEKLGAELRAEQAAHASARATREQSHTELTELRAQSEKERADLAGRLSNTTQQLEETERARAKATTTIDEQRVTIAELERSAAESSQFAQTAAREFKEILRQHDIISVELSGTRQELQRQLESNRLESERTHELTSSIQSLKRDLTMVRDERDAARAESTRFERELKDHATHHHHTTNEVFERSIAEVAVRLNRMLRLFYELPELRPEAPLCTTVAAARTAAEDLIRSLERIHEFWLIEAGGLTLRRDNFGLRHWLSSAAALYEFKATQRDLTLTISTDPEIPDIIATDGERLVDVLSQAADFIIETATPRSEISFSATVLSATTRDARVAFTFSAPCERIDQTAAQQLSLTVAEKIVRLLGGEFTAVEAPGDERRITITLALLRGSGAPVPHTLRSRRRAAREEIEPLPIRPLATAPQSTARTFGVEPQAFDEESDRERSSPSSIAPLPPPRGAIVPRVQSPTMYEPPGEPILSAEDESEQEMIDVREASPPESISPEDMLPLADDTPLEGSPEEGASTPLRVLLAEDNRLNQRMIGDILKSRGYTVVVANDGREALTHLATARFDLALIDCEMPTMDGYAATREIRAAEARIGRHTPIFAMTVYLDNDIEGRCLEAGTDELLTKPVRADALFALIDRYFPERQP